MSDPVVARCACRASGQRGFTLVEALVALLILSIGMLGIAGLFVESVRSSRTALLRTQAISLVADMGDRIRANATARAAYRSADYPNPALHGCAPSSAIPAGANCTVEELAEDDIARWVDAVRTALPGTAAVPPGASIEYFAGANSNTPDRYRIAVSWNEPGETRPFSYRSDVVLLRREPIT